MPPTQSVNVVTSPVFCSSSLESGSQMLPHDHGSWASALTGSQAHRSAEGGAGWVTITLDPVDEATWQEEAHWMSFHHAIQSVVISCHQRNLERTARRSTPTSAACGGSAPHSNVMRTPTTTRPETSPNDESQRSSYWTGGSSLAHSVTRQVMTGHTVPVETIHVSTLDATRLALAQADQDEWEITGMPTLSR